MGVLAEPFMYSTCSAAECESPSPAFTLMYASTPMSRQKFMNSSMPRSLGCMAPQALSQSGGRLSGSPMVWYQMRLEV
jgi:hypothetical protein